MDCSFGYKDYLSGCKGGLPYMALEWLKKVNRLMIILYIDNMTNIYTYNYICKSEMIDWMTKFIIIKHGNNCLNGCMTISIYS